MPERNAVQADFPVGAMPIPNEHGTAPGVAIRVESPGRGSCDVFALPGVPAELKPMWQQTVMPAIAASRGEVLLSACYRRIKCFGVGESQLGGDAPRPHSPRPRAFGRHHGERRDDYAPHHGRGPGRRRLFRSDGADCGDDLRTPGTIAYGEEEEDELETVDVRLLEQQHKTVAVAEWATGGLVSEWLAKAAPVDDVLAGGFVIGSLRQLEQLTGNASLHDARRATPPSLLSLPNGSAVRSVLTTASASPPSRRRPTVRAAAKVCISIATPDRTRRLQFGCASHPAIKQSRTAKQALNALRLILLAKEPNAELKATLAGACPAYCAVRRGVYFWHAETPTRRRFVEPDPDGLGG